MKGRKTAVYVWPAALHRILCAGAVPEGGSTLQGLSDCVMPCSLPIDIIAQQARLARPACPFFHHAFQKNGKQTRSGIGVTTAPACCVLFAHGPRRRRLTTMVPCARHCLLATPATWDGRGHFTRPGMFYSGRPCLYVTVG